MDGVAIIGIDLAEDVLRRRGARADGSVAFRRKLRRARLLPFLAGRPRCVVAMEACGGAHHRGREIERIGREARPIPPAYVKPFVKRQKNDAADAEAIAGAASRPTMRFVAVKSVEKQAAGLTFETRDLPVRRRTQAISALRGHLAEHGVVAPQGPAHLPRLEVAPREAGPALPSAVVELGTEMLSHIEALEKRIDGLNGRIRAEARRDETTRRLMTVPGVGTICAVALAALAPPVESFSEGRDFAARDWGSRRGRTPLAARRGWGGPRRWASAT